MAVEEQEREGATEVEHRDVLIVGAGLSGIGAAAQLEMRCPGRSYAILEARDAIGGTWDLFRYPGIRSDSDMHTLGYVFKPWTQAEAIADGPAILSYVKGTAREYGVEDKVRFGHRVTRVEWSSVDARWTVEGTIGEDAAPLLLTCGFLMICSGYYDYDNAYTPEFEGTASFKGRIVHPQHWPEDLDYEGKRVVIIGSGATAVTMVPAMAETAEHVTMLQRSPSYMVAVPARDSISAFASRHLPEKAAYWLVRWKNVLLMMASFNLSRRRPDLVRKLIRMGVVRMVPPDYEVDKHFNPAYDPWDQRMCLVPDADLFKTLHNGSAEIVTDQIEEFTEKGLRLASGDELEADVIVTATGLNLQFLGGALLVVNGREVDPAETMTYKSLMLGDIPNMAFTIGYPNASWTLKADLTAEYVCRLLNHMEEHGYETCVPRNRDPSVTEEPLIDFSAGYITRSLDELPKQGSKLPWKLRMNYPRDILTLRYGGIEDGTLEFGTKRQSPQVTPPR